MNSTMPTQKQIVDSCITDAGVSIESCTVYNDLGVRARRLKYADVTADVSQLSSIKGRIERQLDQKVEVYMHCTLSDGCDYDSLCVKIYNN